MEMSAMNNTDGCASNETYGFEDTVRPMVSWCFGLIGVTGFIGNILVILVVLLNSQMRSTTNILILNLATADLLFVVFCIPFTAADYMERVWPFGEIWCKTVQYMIVVTVHASIYTLVLMSLDRFLAVVYPIASRSIRTDRCTFKTIVILWIVAVVTAIPLPFIYELSEFTDQGQHYKTCGFKADNGYISPAAYNFIFFSSSYVIPLILISGLYLRMCLRLWHSGVLANSRSPDSNRGRKRVTRLVVVVVAAFATLWFPIQLILVLKSLGLYQNCTRSKILLQIFSHVLAYTTACINPLLYAFLSENFRKAFKKAMYCGPLSSRYSLHHHLPSKYARTSSVAYAENV